MRLVANGQLVVDYTEDDPSQLHNSPLGLQFHNNKEPQEWRLRGLLLVEDPEDELATLKE